MSVNQLIAKALSTESEDEAIACLRMARRRGDKVTSTAVDPVTIEGRTIQQWRDLCYSFNASLKVRSEDLKRARDCNTILAARVKRLEQSKNNSPLLHLVIACGSMITIVLLALAL